jgi:CTP:molybdopterin cytidylyltransferase MocA
VGIAAVVLAAGASSRLGRPKQLVEIEGTPLVRRAAEAAIEAGCAPVVVVLGCAAGAVRPALRGLYVEIVEHRAWSRGVGSTIAAGVSHLESRRPPVDAVLLCTCDQVKLDADVLRQVLAAYDGAAGRRVGCAYAGTVGVPALFARDLIPDLLGLPPEAGARSLLMADPERLARVPWPDGALDLDTPEDAAALGGVAEPG